MLFFKSKHFFLKLKSSVFCFLILTLPSLQAQIKLQTGAMGAEGKPGNIGLYAVTGSASCVISASTECDANPTNSALVMNTTTNKEFIFDSFSKYNGGLTINGSTILKVKVADNALSGGTCRWKLQMAVSNGTSPDDTEWETMSSYGSGSSGSKPTLDILQVRIDNGCHTPNNAGVYIYPFTTSLSPGNTVDIINNGPLVVFAGNNLASCNSGSTNGVGTYLGLDYSEYSFVIDYRIVPGFDYLPGRYELAIKFCLTED